MARGYKSFKAARILGPARRAGRAGTRAAKRWQFVAFPGPQGRESRGIVALIAIRGDHRATAAPMRSGDLFEIVLVQIKGGGAAWPTVTDLERLAAVRRRYRARAVVLAAWRRGADPGYALHERGPCRGYDPGALDAPIVAAIVSASHGRALPAGVAFAGEVALDGCVRGAEVTSEEVSGLGLRLLGAPGRRLVEVLGGAHLHAV